MSHERIGGGIETMLGVVPQSRPAVADPAEGEGAEPTDINSASPEQLRCLAGIGVFYANRIVRGRPYRHVSELVHKRILPLTIYDGIIAAIVAGPLSNRLSCMNQR